MSDYSDGYRQALVDVAHDLYGGNQSGWAKRYRGWVEMIDRRTFRPERVRRPDSVRVAGVEPAPSAL